MTDVPRCDKVPPTPNGDRSLPFGLRCPLNPFQKAIQMKIRQLVPALLYGLLLAGPVFADARFEAETTREAEAVKLARDTARPEHLAPHRANREPLQESRHGEDRAHPNRLLAVRISSISCIGKVSN
jgi:hypothetical protein